MGNGRGIDWVDFNVSHAGSCDYSNAIGIRCEFNRSHEQNQSHYACSDRLNRRWLLEQVLDELWQRIVCDHLLGRRINIGKILWHSPKCLRHHFADVFDYEVFCEILMNDSELAQRRLAVYAVLENGSHEYMQLKVSLRSHTRCEIHCGKIVLMHFIEQCQKGYCYRVQRAMQFLWNLSEKDSAALTELLKEGV